MKVNVRLFSTLRREAGCSELELDLDDGATVDDAIDRLCTRPGLGPLLDRMPVGAAVNREYAPRDRMLEAGDELALIPPVSGGEAVHARVTEEPLSLGRLAAVVGRPGAGAIVTFQGTTRAVERLDYEAYAEMAEERIAAILADCVREHGLEAAAAEHRIGPVPLGEASVAIAVSAPHRTQAFAGARAAIDRIKAEAPVWKVEVEGGERRPVDGTPAPLAEPRRR